MMALYMKRAVRRNSDLPIGPAEREARVQLAAAYRVFAELGWTEAVFNHITLRVPGEERIFLINPFGLLYHEVTASNLVAIDIDGDPVRETPYPVNRAGFVPHSAIHGAIDEAHCVMHTHTTSGVAVASLEDGLSVDNFYGAQLRGRVAYHEFEGVTVEPGEKDRLIASIDGRNAVILRNHGLLTWAPTVPEAFMWMWILQRACDVQIAMAAAGAPRRIRPEALERSGASAAFDEKALCELNFAAMVRRIEARDPGYKT